MGIPGERKKGGEGGRKQYTSGKGGGVGKPRIFGNNNRHRMKSKYMQRIVTNRNHPQFKLERKRGGKNVGKIKAEDQFRFGETLC